jgi:hypothetical protein
MCISDTSIQQLTLHKQYFPQNLYSFIQELDHKLSPRTCALVAIYSSYQMSLKIYQIAKKKKE